MRKRFKVTLIILLIIGLAVLIIPKMEFPNKINQTIKANVYINGNSYEETDVEINGSRSNYLFKKEQLFTGSFCIRYYEKTCREDMRPAITWYKKSDTQIIIYSQNATAPSLELLSNLIINETMDEFAIGFNDGTIIATSDEMYDSYIKKFTFIK